MLFAAPGIAETIQLERFLFVSVPVADFAVAWRKYGPTDFLHAPRR